MASLIYSAITSLDGYTTDAAGNFDWAMPDDEMHAFINDLERPVGTYLYGRRMYDTMVYWETAPADRSTVGGDYAGIWRAADKIVYSTTLEAPSSSRTRIARAFDPEMVRQLKTDATRDIGVGGPHLAAQALHAGLVDEIQLFVMPIMVGGGNAALPDGLRVPLELMEERRLGNGAVYLRYRVV